MSKKISSLVSETVKNSENFEKDFKKVISRHSKKKRTKKLLEKDFKKAMLRHSKKKRTKKLSEKINKLSKSERENYVKKISKTLKKKIKQKRTKMKKKSKGKKRVKAGEGLLPAGPRATFVNALDALVDGVKSNPRSISIGVVAVGLTLLALYEGDADDLVKVVRAGDDPPSAGDQ